MLETLDDRTYTWDRMFNKTQRNDIRIADAHRTHIYIYDAAYRLTFSMGIVVDPAVPEVPIALIGTTTYNLDGVHNRLSTVGPGPAAGIYTMNPTACDNLGNPVDGADLAMNKYTTTPLDQRSYDSNGNLTRILGNDTSGNALAISCLYDYRNRMVEYYDSATGQRLTHDYGYDPAYRMMQATATDTAAAEGPAVAGRDGQDRPWRWR